MNVTISTSSIHPSPEVNDCPILFIPESTLSVTVPGDLIPANPTEHFNPGWYTLGPIACDQCIYNCNDARVEVHINTIAIKGRFNINETEVKVGTRLIPEGKIPINTTPNDDSNEAQTKITNEQTFISSDERKIIEDADSIIDAVSLLSDPDIELTVSKDGQITQIDPSNDQ